MASTYSSNLKIELIATGEQAGLWGATTNNNFTNVFEQAIVGRGTANFPADADLTLTFTDSVSSQTARNVYLNVTSGVSLTQTRNLVVPTINKNYVIQNNTTGSQSILVKTTAGTGITVPNGFSCAVYVNGTDVIQASNFFPNVNANQVNIRNQGDLRLEDTTGGEYVALQAPSTLASSYTLTMPVDDGTNGQALITDGSGNLSWSTAASGDVYGPASATDNAIARFDLTTGKLIQNSSALVDDAGNVLAGAGLVGAPAFSTTGDTNTGIFFPAADTIAFTEGGVESGRFTSTGALQLNNNLTFSGTGNRITGDFSNATLTNRVLLQTSTTNGNTNLGVISNGTATQTAIRAYNNSDPTNAGELSLLINTTEARLQAAINGTGTYLPLTFRTNNVETMRLDTSNQVGIGTTSPSAKLQITTSATSASAIKITDGTNYTLVGGYAAASVGYFGGDSGSALALYSNGSERLRIDTSGNVGIGTSSPATKLDTAGTIRSTANTNPTSGSGAEFSWDGTNASFFGYNRTGSAWLPAQFLGSTAKLVAQTSDVTVGTVAGANAIFTTSNTERMRIDSSGNVGIGTSSPSVRLQVSDGGDTGDLRHRVGNSRYVEFIRNGVSDNWVRSVSTGADFIIDQNSNANLIFRTNATERMRIDSSGNVGIGTSSPFSLLAANKAQGGASTIIGVQNDGTAGNSTKAGFGFYDGGAIRAALIRTRDGGASPISLETYDTVPLLFGTNNTERMRIDSSGRVCINTTSFITDTSSVLNVTSNDVTTNIEAAGGTNAGACSVMRRRNGTGNFLYFVYTTSNTYVGQISTNGTTTSYTSASDYRLKDEITPMTGALETVAQLNPVKFKFKSDNSNGQGFIAHELQAVVPDAVVGEKDAVDIDGKPVYQGVDTSFLVATLTSAIQELHEIVKAQAAEIALLKSK